MTRLATPPLALHPLAELNESKHLPGMSYKLVEGYGLDISFTDSLDIDEKKMAVWIPYADGQRRDGVGDLLVVEGIDESRHRKNPIHLFDHGKSVTLPVGKVEDPETGRYTGIIDPVTKVAKDLVYYYQGTGLPGVDKGDEYDHALFCQQVFHLLAQKFIRGGSIGYQVIQARELPPEPMYGTPKGLHLLAVLKLESSTVVMPANADTVRKGLAPDLREVLAMPRVCGKPLSPMLVKSLIAYTPENTKTVSGYARKMKRGPEGEYCPHCDARLERDPDSGKCNRCGKPWPEKKSQPSDDIDPDKARQILRDGEVHGKPLTEDQRRMFGAAAGRGEKAEPKPNEATVNTRLPYAQAQARASSSPKMGVREQADGWYVYDEATGKNQFGPFFSSGIALIWAQRLNMGKKNVKELRKKYRRTAKGLVRRLKRSSPGSSVIYMAGKDLEKARKEAEAKGIKFQHVSSKNGTAKVRLTGDDGLIDEVAKGYGRLVKFQGAKGLKGFSQGDHVEITSGEYAGMTGVVYGNPVPQHGAVGTPRSRFGETQHRIQIDGFGKPGGWDGKVSVQESWLRKKSQPLREPQRTNVHAGTEEVGETVVARRAIMQIQNDYEYFAQPGDQLTVVGRNDVGQMRVRNRAGVEQSVTSIDVRRKAMGMKANPLTLIMVGDEVEVIPGSGGHTQYHGGDRGIVKEVRSSGYVIQIPGEPRPTAFEKDEVKLVRKKSMNTKGFQEKVEEAKTRFRQEGSRGIDWVFDHMSKTERDAFDQYLVQTQHPLAYEPGTQESRFRRYVSSGGKALKDTKSMKHTKKKDGDDLPVGDESTTVSGEERQLPLGAQVLRRIHEDNSLLLQDYDEMLGPLENEAVKARLQRKLEGFTEELTELEEEFGKLYPDLGGLVGTKDDDALEDAADMESDGEPDNDKEEYEEELEATPKDMDTMDDDAVGSSSEVREEVSPEDALEGMEAADEEAKEDEKSLRRTVKSLRKKYGKKGMCPECGKEDCDCGKTEEKGQKIAPALVAAAAPAVGQLVGSALTPKDKSHVKEAGGFLGEMGQPDSVLDDEGRMKSYHYHKTLSGMAQLDEARNDLEEGSEDLQDSGIPPAEWEPGVGAKAEPGTEEWEEEERREREHQGKSRKAIVGPKSPVAKVEEAAGVETVMSKTEPGISTIAGRGEMIRQGSEAIGQVSGAAGGMKGQMEILGNAAGLLKELAFLPEMDDDHRGRSSKMCKALNDFIGPDEEAHAAEEGTPEGVVMEEETMEEEEPGMEVKFLADEADLQNKKIAELTRMLSRLPILN